MLFRFIRRLTTGALLGAALVMPAAVHAQTSAPLAPVPKLEADTLAGAHVVLPADAGGQPMILIVGFDRSAEAQLQAWSHAVAAKIGTRARLYAVVDAAGAPFFVHGAVRKQIAKDAPPTYPQHASNILITFKNDGWTAIAPAGKPSEVAAIVIDAKGVVVAARREVYTPAALDALLRAVP